MKPLSEWTVEELTDLLHENCDAWPASWFVPEVVAEIQRRERERCLQVVCEAVMGGRRRGDSIAEETGVIMTTIERLQ